MEAKILKNTIEYKEVEPLVPLSNWLLDHLKNSGNREVFVSDHHNYLLYMFNALKPVFTIEDRC
jgi:hypothetical protein